MYNGIINVYKEPGYTSHDVVARLRGITHQKKIGHTGTLDPAAEGVLCVCLGAATHVCDMLTDETKEYEAVLLLGVKTDTQDTTGTILETRPVEAAKEEILKVIAGFTGEIQQVPPMYSARKVNGRKLYDYARAGITVERSARRVNIFDIKVISTELPRVTMRVVCSKGTYIRTLCNDIGEKLGCGGAMEHLIRTRVGRFCVEEAYRLEDIAEFMERDALEEILVSPESLFDELPVFVPNAHGIKMAENGNILSMNDISCDCVDAVADIIGLHNGDNVRITGAEGFFYGIYSYDETSNILRPAKMFFCQTQ